MWRISAGVLVCCAVSAASGQSYNIDFGDAGDAPGSSYAAAGLKGVWNTLGVPTPGVYYPLVNLQGQATGAELYNIGGTQILSTDNGATSGDHDALMDDMLIGFNNPIDVCIWVRNLPPGSYEVMIYAMTPNDAALMSRTRVDFANEGPAFVGGAWPGGHQLLTTYSRFTVTIGGNTIGLHSGLQNGLIQSGINGIQIRRLKTGDTNGDAVVNIQDLLNVVAGWGPCPSDPPMCAGDITGDQNVNIQDLLAVVANWGT